jgi:hypothetical protein
MFGGRTTHEGDAVPMLDQRSVSSPCGMATTTRRRFGDFKTPDYIWIR